MNFQFELCFPKLMLVTDCTFSKMSAIFLKKERRNHENVSNAFKEVDINSLLNLRWLFNKNIIHEVNYESSMHINTKSRTPFLLR